MTCHVDLSTFWLLVIIKMFIELIRFIELRKKEKNEWLYFNVLEYLIDLF